MAKDWTGILMANGKGLDTQVRPGFWWLIALSGQSSVAGQNFVNPGTVQGLTHYQSSSLQDKLLQRKREF